MFGGFVIRARPITTDLEPNFCKYCFRAEVIRRALIRRCQGAIRGNIGQSDMSGIRICLPPRYEQAQISEILSTWDRATETVEKLIENSERQKKAVAQRVLHGGKRWDVVRLGMVATLTAGGTPSTKKPEYWGGEVPWMNSGEINLRRVTAVEGRISDAGLANSSAKMLHTNCVLVALAGQGTTRGKVAINLIPLSTNQSVAAIQPDQELDAEYLFHNLEGRYSELRSLSLGDGGRGGLNLSILKSLVIPLPPIPEQKEIARLLTVADSEIEKWSLFKCCLQKEKTALMQQLLTGKRRVKVDGDVDRIVQEASAHG
ncbi:MAG: restriction endonuclease subunit S [bacterium]